MYKFSGLTLFFLLYVLTEITVEANRNITWGTRGFYDTLLQRDVVFRQSRFLRQVTVDYKYEQKNVSFPLIITQIVVTDQYTNGRGGFCTLTQGGIHMTFVRLRFTSQRGHGLNFIVDIYGH